MRRRDFIKVIAGSAAAWPLAARAQQPVKLPTIGFLGQSTRTVAIVYRWAEGSDERFADIATEFVRLKVDVIVTSGTSQVLAAKRATSVIPIVFATAGDPVGNNLVASLTRPGGNVT